MCHRVAYFSINKLNQSIKTQKDPLNNMFKKNVVYKIDCSNYDASYVSQTGRKLKTRLIEHRYIISSSYNIVIIIYTENYTISHFRA